MAHEIKHRVIDVAFGTGIKRPVTAIKIQGLLCVHKGLTDDRKYTITHIPTGMAVHQDIIKKYVAMRTMELLHMHPGWVGVIEAKLSEGLRVPVREALRQAEREMILTEGLIKEI